MADPGSLREDRGFGRESIDGGSESPIAFNRSEGYACLFGNPFCGGFAPSDPDAPVPVEFSSSQVVLSALIKPPMWRFDFSVASPGGLGLIEEFAAR